MAIRIRRAYDPAEPGDGVRILVDRLWPRGVPKAELPLDAWPKAIAPTSELRKWYGHDPERFAEFAVRYRAELAQNAELLAPWRAAARKGNLTLVTATKDLDTSHAEVLRQVLEKKAP